MLRPKLTRHYRNDLPQPHIHYAVVRFARHKQLIVCLFLSIQKKSESPRSKYTRGHLFVMHLCHLMDNSGPSIDFTNEE